jgi:predicted O-methyltransferase YrrM
MVDEAPSYPPLVQRAIGIARELGFPLTHEEDGWAGPSCSLPGVGRLLATLAASCAGGRIGEVGSGVGFGAAWMVSAMPADATLLTVELDEARAAAVRDLFADDPRVTVVQGDAAEVMAREQPFDLVFLDGGLSPAEHIIDMARIGGQLVVDDVTPTALLAAGSPHANHDVKRELFFGSPRLVSMEVVLPDLQNAAFVGTRVQ